MWTRFLGLVAAAVLSITLAAHAEPQAGDPGKKEPEQQFKDFRTVVEMPEKARQILLEDMLDHLAVLNEINRYLYENNLDAAAETAETGMGKSLLAKYQDVELRPGHYMPETMRRIGWELHSAATEFATIARQGNLKKTLQAYHRITTACVACHYSYRIR